MFYFIQCSRDEPIREVIYFSWWDGCYYSSSHQSQAQGCWFVWHRAARWTTNKVTWTHAEELTVYFTVSWNSYLGHRLTSQPLDASQCRTNSESLGRSFTLGTVTCWSLVLVNTVRPATRIMGWLSHSHQENSIKVCWCLSRLRRNISISLKQT